MTEPGPCTLCPCDGSPCICRCHFTGELPTEPDPAVEWLEFLDRHWQGKTEHRRGTF